MVYFTSQRNKLMGQIKLAAGFAEGDNPVIFKFVTKTFMERGVDVSWLSVYEREKEALYPPLTYIKPVRLYFEEFEGKRFVVAEVSPSFPT